MPTPEPSCNPNAPLSTPWTAGRRATNNEKGGTAIKYALMAAGVGAIIAIAVYGLGATSAGLYQAVANLF
jgi:Flp pilus assembly pilin Flp